VPVAEQDQHRVFKRSPTRAGIGRLIFMSRWLQAPLYLGLIVAQAVYVVIFVIQLWHLIENVLAHGTALDESEIMLAVLGLIDVVMVANLLIMVVIGGYETFVSRLAVRGHPDEPEWLSYVNANVLKVKLAMAIIGISSVHLLATFIGVADLGADNGGAIAGTTYTSAGVFWQVVIHCVFIVSALALALIDRMHHDRPAPRELHETRPSTGRVEVLRQRDSVSGQ
jgi:uncharacterized protein (TIGR00645 family)